MQTLRACFARHVAAWKYVLFFVESGTRTQEIPVSPSDSLHTPSYYGVTFLLPRYYHDMSGGKEDFVFILTAAVGVSFIPGMVCVSTVLGAYTGKGAIDRWDDG